MSQRISQQQLESYLWGAAVYLRGTIDAGDYKQYIFPLLFYKRLCDVFDEETSLALEESGGDAEFAAYPENHRFQVPPDAHWSQMRQVSTNVGQALQSGMRTIETANPDKLFGIFGDAQWTNKERLSDEMLRDLVEHFSALSLSLANLPEDELGQGYEFLIKKFADDSGHTAAEFYTNRTVVHLMTEMLEPQPGDSIYDPTCGSGGMLLSCVAHLRRRDSEWRNVRLFGQEKNLMTSSIARMNCFLHGIEDFAIMRGDTLSEPKLVEGDQLMRFDLILANPPYSIKQWDRTAFTADPWGRNIYGVPPQGRADYAFQQHILKSLKPRTGRCAVLWPHGILFRNEEDTIRRRFIEDDVIEAVIGLGPNLFYNSSMQSCVVVCRVAKAEERRGKILFIDASNEVTRERAQSCLSREHIDRITNAYRTFGDEPGFSKVADIADIRENGWSLNIPLYVRSTQTDALIDSTGELVAEAVEAWLEGTTGVARTLADLGLESEPIAWPEYLVDYGWQVGREDRSGRRRVRLGDVCQEISVRVNDPASSRWDRFVGLEHLDSGSLRVHRWGSTESLVSSMKAFWVGDTLFARRNAYLKRASQVSFEGLCSGDAIVLRERPNTLIPGFLVLMLNTNRFWEFAIANAAGTMSRRVNVDTLLCYEFDLPPLDQQRRIADLLWAVDEAAYAVRSALVDAYSSRRAFLNTTFSSLLKSCQVMPVRSTGFLQLGRQRAPKYQTGQASKPYLRVANVFDGYFDYSDVLQMDFDERDFAAYSLRKDDILLNEGQSRELVGRCAVYDGRIADCCFQNTLIRYRAGDSVLTEYAFAFFQYCFYFGVFASIASQTTSVAHLGLDRFGALKIPIPPTELQEHIGGRYASIRNAESCLVEHLNTLEDLKRSLFDALI